MTNCLQLNIPTGYTVTQEKVTVGIDEAVDILKTRRRRKYISAFRSGYETFAELRKDVWRCPYCNHERPTTLMVANTKRAGKYLYGSYAPTKAQIERWGTHQLSLFEKDDEKLILNSAPIITGEQMCSKCGRKSLPSLSQREVNLTYNKQQIVLRAEVSGLGELLAIPWVVEGTITIKFPIYEVVTFDLNTGHTTIELQSANDVCVAKRDITTQPYVWEKGVVYQLIRDNVVLNRTMKRLFSDVFGGLLPFGKDELTPDKYILMTRFVGFPRRFYDAVPYVPGGFQIEESFRSVEKKLHSAEDAFILFDTSALPKCKSIKKIVYSNPGLLFYLPECENLWAIINDVNHFRALLKDDSVFNVLSILHQRPRLFEYVSDYCRVKGARAMLSVITEGWLFSIEAAIDYCTMCDSMKLAEQQQWKDRTQKNSHIEDEDEFDDEDDEYEDEDDDEGWYPRFSNRGMMFSVPMKKPITEIVNCVIDGFSFSWLRSGNDYYMVGKALRNCLGRWRTTYNPVVAVKQEEKIVAAIEVGPDGIHQVQGYHNSCISRVNGLSAAYEKWCERFNLKDLRCSYEDMPF